ncbi:MAG: T9SS type A sorting domain-containing protein, partial [Bacteroidia bacterium]|nr:T9SS type A sorting domain-containing protein [Bacteroidia bacterium]
RTVQTSFGHVKLKSESATNDYSTEVYFNSNATRGLDPGYDASLFGGSAPEFSIYSHLVEDNQDVPMGIQALGATDFSDVTIPLGIHVTQGEQVTVSMIENTVPSNINVYLEDNVENTFTLLNSGDYIFTPSTTLNTTGRFFLRFSDSALSTEEEQFNGISIYGLTTERIIRVDGLLNQDTELIVYDLQGRKVMSQHLDMNINTQRIDASALHAGVYVVELNNKDQRKTSKIIFK